MLECKKPIMWPGITFSHDHLWMRHFLLSFIREKRGWQTALMKAFQRALKCGNGLLQQFIVSNVSPVYPSLLWWIAYKNKKNEDKALRILVERRMVLKRWHLFWISTHIQYIVLILVCISFDMCESTHILKIVKIVTRVSNKCYVTLCYITTSCFVRLRLYEVILLDEVSPFITVDKHNCCYCDGRSW